MEEAVTRAADTLLPGAIEMPFAEIAAALAAGRDPASPSTPPRTLTATVVAVCSADRLVDAARTLQELARRTAVRSILISEGSETRPKTFVAEEAVAVPGLKASFVNNAVATLRLSSLPTIVWWRGCSADMLDDLADLSDRLILDDEDPVGIWTRVVELFEQTAFSDTRWARLTRWRSLMANLFDIPEVRTASGRLDRLEIKGRDPHAAALFAAWLKGSLGPGGALRVRVEAGSRDLLLEEVRLTNDAEELKLSLTTPGCVLSSSTVKGHSSGTRMVALGDQSDVAILAEELRVRVRDLAFEAALREHLTTRS
jgi:glucose-6-phosphate dehydrogenase assembly protein OpcA